MTTVAVLGTGRMGSAMARALHAAGHDLVLYNRTAATARTLASALGARVAAEPKDAVANAAVAITMLADGRAVEDTYRRPNGILEGIHPGVVLLEMSTVEPRISRTLEPSIRERGGALLDAPVSGSVTLAESGKLTVMVGGDADALERARPVLDALAGRVFHLGPIGNGAAMKLAVNAVIFGLDVALAEALVMAERAGVDRAAAWDVFEASAIGAPFVGYKRAAFLDPATTPVAFALDLAAKDLGLIADLAEETGVPAQQARTNLEVIRAAAGSVGGERDFADVAEHLRRRRPVAAGGGEGPTH
jgi:3-hydroxyisobutyrate dehydrogenase/2-hydroxy-3-oxopropionate reductase